MRRHTLLKLLIVICSIFHAATLYSADYHVGEGLTFTAIGDVRWEALQPGDTVYIHYRPEPYREKWVVGRSGTAEAPIRITGVPGPNGELPVISGENATTRTELNYTNEERGLIKIGSSSVPRDTLPQHIIIENLDLQSARPPYSFLDDTGSSKAYINNAAAVYVEKAAHLTIRNCIIHDSGNGIFVGAFDGATRDILIEKNHIYDNGNVGRYYEHNTYTAAIGITYQYNRMGSLRDGAGGNNLKDRSAGLTVKYNWIENGNRQLDLVDGEDSSSIVDHPSYHTTYVYGNVLLEANNQGNSQMVHYGGDSGNEDGYRKGTLYFFNNTLVSTRDGNTTMVRLSTNDETGVFFNNIVHVTAPGYRLALAENNGLLTIGSNWFPDGYRLSHGSFSSSRLTDLGTSIVGSNPGFVDLLGGDHHLLEDSPARNMGVNSYTGLEIPLPDKQYKKHQAGEERVADGSFDMGAFEFSIPAEPLQIGDVIKVLQVSAGGEPAGVSSFADVDGDHKVGLSEAIQGLSDVQNDSFVPVALQSSVSKVQPMTGIVFWDDSQHNSSDAIQLEYRYVGFDEMITGENQYDWSLLESTLDSIAGRGHQAILRFYLVYPGRATTVPAYIKDMSGYVEESGITEGQLTWFPDWSSSALEDCVLDFYEQFASRYDNDPRLAFLQVGFGLWGEYHIYEGPMVLGGTFPSKEFQATFLTHLGHHFQQLKWSLSIDAADTENYSPFGTTSLLDLEFGLFDDSFNHANHDGYNKDCFNFFSYDTRYLTGPVGGELSYYTTRDQRDALDPTGPNGVSFENRAAEYHVSYMIGNDQPDYASMERIEEAGMAIGYHFKITSLETSSSATRGTVENIGIGPIYYDAYVTVNGKRSSESLRGLVSGQSLDFMVETTAGPQPVVTIECDRLVSGQKIEFDADLR